MNPTLYDVIGLTPDSSEEQIYRAVKKTTRTVRESDAPVSEKRNLIRIIKKCRDTLMDPDQREQYDRTIGIDTIRNERDDSGMKHADWTMVPFGLSSNAGSLSPFDHMNPIGSLMSSHMEMMQSIIPQEFGGSNPKRDIPPGTFHFMEYTKTRNASGGFDEFGLTREGDTNNDRVTEKRFHKKS